MLFTRLINSRWIFEMSCRKAKTHVTLEDLEKYLAGRKSSYETLRSFRHDYTNVKWFRLPAIQMKKTSIKSRWFGDKVPERFAIRRKQQKFDLAKLTRVTNMPLKSLYHLKCLRVFFWQRSMPWRLTGKGPFSQIVSTDLINCYQFLW